MPFEPSLAERYQVNASLTWLITGALTLNFELSLIHI